MENVSVEEEVLEGCLCEYVREDYREQLERLIAAKGGGEPGTAAAFANVVIQVNDAIRRHLIFLGDKTARPVSSAGKRGSKITQRKGKLSGAGI